MHTGDHEVFLESLTALLTSITALLTAISSLYKAYRANHHAKEAEAVVKEHIRACRDNGQTPKETVCSTASLPPSSSSGTGDSK